MAIDVVCPCGKVYAVLDEYAGKKLRCRECQRLLAIPAPPVAEEMFVSPEDVTELPGESGPVASSCPTGQSPVPVTTTSGASTLPDNQRESDRLAGDEDAKKSETESTRESAEGHPDTIESRNVTATSSVLTPGPAFPAAARFGLRQKVEGLSPQEYEHNLDRMFLNALQKTMGFETLVRAVFKHGVERYMTICFTGSGLRLGPAQMADAYNTVVEARDLLDLPQMPEVYVQQGFLNAATIGSENPIVVFDTGCFGVLDPDEFLFVAGHELGHIKSGHCLYRMIADLISTGLITAVMGAVPILGGLATTGIEASLGNWMRLSEFTADRAGLLCCQDLDAALRCLMKMAGLPPSHRGALNLEAFKEQAREFRAMDFNTRDKIIKLLAGLGATHPWTVMRGHELLKWYESGDYERVLTRHTRIHGALTVRTERPETPTEAQFIE